MTPAAAFSYGSVDDRDVFRLIAITREGITYAAFSQIVKQSPFSLTEWADSLHISERTLQRYKNEGKAFDPAVSEKILEIMMLCQRGTAVFADGAKFGTWLETKNMLMGGVPPKQLLDTTFGIGLLHDELTRLEHGVLA